MKKLVTSVSALALALSIFAVAPVVSADSEAVTYDYLIGTDFLCELDPSACPAVAMADNGDTMEITGAGAIGIHPKAATGGGTFVHKDPNGAELGSGTWTAVNLLRFHSYGDASAQGLPSFLFGGRADLEVMLDPGAPGGPTFPAILQVDCVLGDQIPAGSVEGVRLNIKNFINFNQEVSGFTVFIAN